MTNGDFLLFLRRELDKLPLDHPRRAILRRLILTFEQNLTLSAPLIELSEAPVDAHKSDPRFWDLDRVAYDALLSLLARHAVVPGSISPKAKVQAPGQETKLSALRKLIEENPARRQFEYATILGISNTSVSGMIRKHKLPWIDTRSQVAPTISRRVYRSSRPST